MNRRRTTAIVHAVLALLLGCPALAAAPDPAPASPPGEYRIGPGDVLAIAVWGEPELSTPAGSGWEVRPDGKISVPLLGEVAASGYTIAAFTERLTRGLAEYVKDPRVTVNVVSFRRVRVQALGQLQQPGQYALPPDARLLDLLALAGGPTERAALSEATLTRAGAADETVHIDLAALLRGGETEWNLALAEGDVLFVPERPPVTVLGEVLRPGVYEARS
ncbi:MAG TPA: polysaccharide biosynthesis/export family protein, partial [Limnochordia bacterium]